MKKGGPGDDIAERHKKGGPIQMQQCPCGPLTESEKLAGKPLDSTCDRCGEPSTRDKLNGERLCPTCRKAEIDRLIDEAKAKGVGIETDLEAGFCGVTVKLADMTLDDAIAEAESVCDDDAAPFCKLKHAQVAMWLKELKERRERDNPWLPQLGANLGVFLGDPIDRAKRTEDRLKELVGEALRNVVEDEVLKRAGGLQAQLASAQRVMANDQVIVAHLVNVIAKHVKRAHWPRIVHEFASVNMARLFGGGEFEASQKMVDAILAEAIEEVDPEMLWCDACRSYHAPQNPSCKLRRS